MTTSEPIRALRESAMIDVEEVATILSCSTRSVYRLADSGRMPRPIKLAGMVRWNRATLLAWIDAGCPRILRGHNG